MKILVLNCGSSSIKYKLFDMDKNFVMAQGGIEKIGLPGSFLKLTAPNGEKVILEEPIPEHTKGIEFIIYLSINFFIFFYVNSHTFICSIFCNMCVSFFYCVNYIS